MSEQPGQDAVNQPSPSRQFLPPRTTSGSSILQVVTISSGDVVSFTLTPGQGGLTVHLLDLTSQVASVLREGDLIISVNGDVVDTPQDFMNHASKLESNVVVIQRLQPEKSEDGNVKALGQRLSAPTFQIREASITTNLEPQSSPQPLVRSLSPMSLKMHDKHIGGRMNATSPSPSASSSGQHGDESDTTVCSDIFDKDDLAQKLDSPQTTSDSNPSQRRSSSLNMWTKARKVVSFLKNIKRKKYPWVQLAGHSEGFKVDESNSGWISKRSNKYEKMALTELMNDVLKPYVPEFAGVEIENNEEYLQMSNLLALFDSPNIIDCKIGCRTYLESEVDNVTFRKDLLAKMMAIDVNEPTQLEKETGVTKLRYMKFRDDVTSIKSMKFRIDACKTRDTAKYNLKSLNNRDEIGKLFIAFLNNQTSISKPLTNLIKRLKDLRAALVISPFFQSHEVIGSSLLFACDIHGNSSVWMIDFAKTIPRPVQLTHTAPWIPGTSNYEDEYLVGLDHIISIFEEKLLEAQ